MNWTGSVNNTARFKQSKDKQAQKDFFRRQKTLRAQKAYREPNYVSSTSGTLARAIHLTKASQIGIQNRPSYKSLHQKVNEFQAAVLLQKCQGMNAKANDSIKLQCADKLLAEASRLSSSLSKDLSAYHLPSTSFVPCDPLFEFDTITSTSSILGYVGHEKELYNFTEATYRPEELHRPYISQSHDEQTVIDEYPNVGLNCKTMGVSIDSPLSHDIAKGQRSTSWSQWNQNVQMQTDGSSDVNDELASMDTSQSNERYPVSLSVSSLGGWTDVQ